MRSYSFTTNADRMENDLLDEVRQFGAAFVDTPIDVRVEVSDRVRVSVTVGDGTREFSCNAPQGDRTEVKRLIKRFAKHSLYTALSDITGVRLPWGSLTGIRPTKLAYAYLSEGGRADGIAEYLSRTFSVRSDRAEIVRRIIETQRRALPDDLTGAVDLYIHVPFCNGRCDYCSFPSADINAKGADRLLDGYTDALIKEIGIVKRYMSDRGLRILSVYIGGGTPSVLGEEDISRLLEAVDCRGAEFTFEAGRADSLTAGKIDVMKNGGVTRICVNPQSLNDATLARMGRRHTSADFYEAYSLAASAGLSINTDIIAGLDESAEDFERTADGIAALSPDNVTVHTLSRKRASLLADTDPYCPDIERMTEYAFRRFADYEPYYLYRQKNMAGNLENVGFCKRGTECINNITVMEELVPVFACGAGSISKRISGGVIARYASPKDVGLYIAELDERTEKKLLFFDGA